MAERSAISQVVQIGVETTSGVAVAADKQFRSISIQPGIEAENNRFRPQGTKYPTLVTPGMEWSTARISGQPTYDELSYLLASVLANPTISTTGTTGKQHAFAPNSTTEDTVKTFTVEQGSAVRAHKFAYGIVKDFTLDFSRENIEVGGVMLGQLITDAITLTGSPTVLPDSPILPNQLDVYLDTTSGGIGTTKLTRVLSGQISLTDRFGPLWVVNSANPSWVAHVETEPNPQLKLKVAADAAGMAFLGDMRVGTTKFFRLKATGPQIGAGPATYLFTWDAAVKVEDVQPWEDEDGIFAIEWTFAMVHDGTWGKAMDVKLVNTLAAL